MNKAKWVTKPAGSYQYETTFCRKANSPAAYRPLWGMTSVLPVVRLIPVVIL